MQMAKGRNFSAQLASDSSAIIINEAAAKLLPFADPLNKALYLTTSFKTKIPKPYRIVGVVKDFNFNSLRQKVTPLALFFGEEKGSVAIRLKTSDVPSLITQVQNKWKSVVPGQPFNYSFMNEDFNKIYKSEQRIGKIAMSFSVLAIFIACLGLFGLVTYAAEQRTKEIGIRKVLGATVTNIVGILSKDFFKLVIISALIAFPVAWWAMSTWLQDFAYRTNISWWIFLLAIGIALFIALATISFQAIKAAIANPVKNLRTE
jgi:putative ABC transport system permease protein